MSRHIAEEQHRHPHEFVGDLLLGLNDGIATTLVFALSVAGAASAQQTVVVAGLAEMLAGGVSMFLGGFISAQSVKEAMDFQIHVERQEIEQEPEEEREELRNIYREKGFSEPQVTDIVGHLTSDPERWLGALVRDELLLRPGEFPTPWKVGGTISLAFMAGAFVPLIPFLVRLGAPTLLAALFSFAALFATGAARSRYSRLTWLWGGVQMLVVGIIGALAGVVIGHLLSGHS